MKVVVIHVSAGAGHRRSAEAVYNYCRQGHYGRPEEISLVDALDKTPLFFRAVYRWGYLFMVHHAPWLWHLAFRITSLKQLRPLSSALHRLSDRIFVSGLSGFFIREEPDVIISTHFLPSEVASRLKTTGRLRSRLITVITDFAVHPFWINVGTDLYVVACEPTRDQLISSGVSPDSIRAYGIPVDARFCLRLDRPATAAKLNLNPKMFTVLVVTGSFGVGPIEKICDALNDTGVQILAICARNRSLQERLKKKNRPRLRVFGFVDNIEELMAVSDLIVTKPGGSTLAELLAMGLPPVFISPIPGQENNNMSLLLSFGIGEYARSVAQIKSAVLRYRDDPAIAAQARSRIEVIGRPFASRDICNEIR